MWWILAGKDATDDFENVGYNASAKEMMEKHYIGEIDILTIPMKKKYNPPMLGAPPGAVQPTGISVNIL